MRDLILNLVAGKQKAVVGGLVAGVLSLLSTVGVSGDLTVKEALLAAASWVVTHGLVYLKANRS